MLIRNYSLRNLNSFGLDITAGYYFRLEDLSQLKGLVNEVNSKRLNYIIVGEGSNILFTKDFDGVVIHNCLKGIEIIFEQNNQVAVKVFAGENWDKFVEEMVDRSYGGLENLSLIPGSAGASPVQNIGAYGTEVKDRILEVEGYTLPGLEYLVLKNENCEFGYRDSVFKRDLKNRFIITSVTFLLDKNPVFNINYGNLADIFNAKPVKNIKTLREAVIEIRRAKLPDISEYGSAGSFFKNPIISIDKYNRLKECYADIPGYFTENDGVKISAAWLIDKAGWKGVREGDAGIWPSQPLVIVNYGSANGNELFCFSEKIKLSVQEKFGIELVREVNIC